MKSNGESMSRWDDAVCVADDALALASDMQFRNSNYDNYDRNITHVWGRRMCDDYNIDKQAHSSLRISALTSAGQYSADIEDHCNPRLRSLNRSVLGKQDAARVERVSGSDTFRHEFGKKYTDRASLLIARLAAKSLLRDAEAEVEWRRKELEDAEAAMARMYDMINTEAE